MTVCMFVLCINYRNYCHGLAVKRFLTLQFALLTIKPALTFAVNSTFYACSCYYYYHMLKFISFLEVKVQAYKH
jgi:hypothetical protein